MPELHYTAAFLGDQPAAADDCDLPDRRELALVAVERTRMPMVVTDPKRPDNPIILANQAFLDLTGYNSGEIIGQNCRFLQGPRTSELEIDKLRVALRRGDDNISVELLNYRKDGTSFLNALKISAVRTEEGALLYYFASQEDVTEERRAQDLAASEHRLLMEVDHRTMNALALVQSIVRLSQAEDTRSLSSTIARRVESLGKTHRLLAEQQWRSVNLTALVEAQIASVAANDRITVEGDPIELHPRVVQPLGLVMHELLSNAQLHGALANENGSVHVSWAIEGEAVILNWREENPGRNSINLKDGFGLQIVQTIVEQQLGGDRKFEALSGALAATIAIPLPVATVG